MGIDKERIKNSWKEFMKGILQGAFNLDSGVQGSKT